MDEKPLLVSRRKLLGAFGIGAAATAAIGSGAVAITNANKPNPGEFSPDLTYDFFGQHQSGIVTPLQNNLHFVSLDLITNSRSDLIQLLKDWTNATNQMMQGLEIGNYGALGGQYDAPPEDTGEALGLPPSGLTVTFGFGVGLFDDLNGQDRFGVKHLMPRSLIPLPHFPGDMLNKQSSFGDFCIQACANDAQVAVHAIRNLVRIAIGTATVRWSQLGFGKSSATEHETPTPRNLFGFKDGTANILGTDNNDLNQSVWVSANDDPGWMAGGTYLAVRKIRMTIENWDRTSLKEQELVFGRTKNEGAPLSGGGEFSQPDFSLESKDGTPIIPIDSHVALAHPSHNQGAKLLRRGYNYTEGSDNLGKLDAGLFFLAYVRDIYLQFVPIQMQLSKQDLMNEYVRYIAQATFAIPPGVTNRDGYIGETLFN